MGEAGEEKWVSGELGFDDFGVEGAEMVDGGASVELGEEVLEGLGGGFMG